MDKDVTRLETENGGFGDTGIGTAEPDWGGLVVLRNKVRGKVSLGIMAL